MIDLAFLLSVESLCLTFSLPVIVPLTFLKSSLMLEIAERLLPLQPFSCKVWRLHWLGGKKSHIFKFPIYPSKNCPVLINNNVFCISFLNCFKIKVFFFFYLFSIKWMLAQLRLHRLHLFCPSRHPVVRAPKDQRHKLRSLRASLGAPRRCPPKRLSVLAFRDPAVSPCLYPSQLL